MIRHPPRGPCPSHYSLRNQRCFAHNPLRGSTTQRKLTTPDKSPRGFKDKTHTHTPRDTRACPHHPITLLTFCAPHAHPLLPTAMAFVPYGFVLVQVQVQTAPYMPLSGIGPWATFNKSKAAL